MVSGYTKNLEIQTTPSEISSFEGKKKKNGCELSIWMLLYIFYCGWAGGFMLNYMSCAQLSLSEDLPHGFYRLFCLKLSGSDHFLLFALGTVGGKDCDLGLCGFTLTMCPTLNSGANAPETGKRVTPS